jgi:aspartyl aminopeptidase
MDLEFEPKNCWQVFDTPEHLSQMEQLAKEYVHFLSACKTERETIDFVRSEGLKYGFKEDFAQDKVFKIHRDKTIFLARKGKQPLANGVRLLGAHADSPRLDLKQRPLYEECQVALAKTHYYGGIRKHQWLARPLALHGVVIKTDGTKIDIVLGEDPGDPVFTIADLLPHLAHKQVTKKVTEAFEAEKLNVILGHSPALEEEKLGSVEETEETGHKSKGKNLVKQKIIKLLHQKFGLIEEDLYSAELMAVPAGPARFVGLDEALIGGYGQDDRVCVFTGLKAFLAQEEPEYTQALIFWDKEEIGSDGSTGAKSLFLEYCFEDLIESWEPKTNLRTLFQNTKAISADVHAALDPDYQDVHEKLNASLLGHGPVFCKFTGHRGKYGANDAHAEYVAWLRNILNKAGIPWQMAELGKVDIGGGGTVAKFLAIYGLDIIDFGPGVLAMHSPFEITSKADIYATYLAYKEFFQAK